MNTIIRFEPDALELDESIFAEILRAAEVVGEIYDAESAELSVTLTTDAKIRELNREYRGLDRPTDVLSFAFRESDEPEILNAEIEILGDIIISVERAKEQAENFGHSLLREIIFLEVHGLLHLLGYDHIDEADRVEMEAEQDFVMSELGIGRD